MTPTMIGLVGIGVLVVMFFTRMPVAYVMTPWSGSWGLPWTVSPEAGFKILARDIFDTFSS